MNEEARAIARPVAEDRGITLLRCTVAILLGIHGTTRTLTGGVSGFGAFLSEQGLPAGLVVAWAITGFELAGATALLLRRWVVPVAAIFIVELTMGIVMVHFREGWFVVGGGTNGMEYSVLLIMSLLAVLISTWRSHVRQRGELKRQRNS